MTAKEEVELRAVYEKWSVERLAVAASRDQADYQPRAIELMLAELKRRGIDAADLGELIRVLPLTPPPVLVERPGTLLFPTKLNRKQYFLRWVALVAALIGGSLLLELAPAIQPTAFGVWLLLGLGYKILGLDIPRVKNAGASPWLLLLLLVPIANIGIVVFLFAAPPAR